MSVMKRPSKESKTNTILTGGGARLFKDALDYYDNKQYEKALQNAKKIKRHHAQNGETMALEGLVRHSKGEKEEGYNLVKKGLGIVLRYDKGQKEICLPFCFRAYALMYQADLNFDRCVASFRNALRYDPTNIPVLRDLAHAQTLLGDWAGVVDSCRKIITINLSEMKTWIALALAYHQNGNNGRGVKILDKWLAQNQVDIDAVKEIHLKNDFIYKRKRIEKYRLMVLFESKKFERVRDDLLEMKKTSNDPDLDELLGKCYFELGEKETAKSIFFHLLVQSPESHDLIRNYQKTVFRLDDVDLFREGVYTTPEDISQLVEMYEDLLSKIPKSSALKRIMLTICQGKEFEKRYFEYIKFHLTRTVPALFESVKSIYQDSNKVSQMQRIMLRVESSLSEKFEYPTNLFSEESEGEVEEEEEEKREAPSTLPFCYLYLAKHYDKLGDREKGLEYVNKAIGHTPTLCELYMTKARILKHLKRPTEAAEMMEQSRKLDLADRFLNMKSVKYLLLDQKVEEAYEVAFLFAQDHEFKFNLHGQQGIRFQMQLGGSYRRMGRLCLALREFHRVRKYFLSTRKNMNGFHDFFLKKGSVTEYMEMINYVRSIKKEPMYLDATAETVELYLMFHNNPGLAEYRERVTSQEKRKWKIEPKDRQRMDELLGKMTKEKFIQKALELLRELEELQMNRMRTQVLAMEVYSRMMKPLLLLRSIKIALQIEPKSEKCKKAFEILKTMKVGEKTHESVKKLLGEEIKELEGYFQS